MLLTHTINGCSTSSLTSQVRALTPFRTLNLLVLLLIQSTFQSTFAQEVGTTTGNLTVTDAGTVNYSVAIAVPPGINGVQPQLAINYSSGAGNGIAGIGGSLAGLASINRCGQTIFRDAQANHGGDISLGRASGVDLTDNDQFCLGGQGLVLVNGSHATTSADYRTEIESFQRIKITSVSNGPQTFTVETPNGGIMTFGGTSASRVSHSDGRVIQWLVSSFTDAFGNTIDYHYSDYGTGGAKEILLDDVTYGGTANIKVELDYEFRPDIRQAFRFGESFSTTQRLTNILTSVDGEYAKDYQIDYAETPVSQLSRMTQVTECSGGGICLPPVVFDWNEVSPSWASGGSVPDAMVDAAGRTRGIVVDINGDGRKDWVTSFEQNGVHTAQTWLGNENGGWDSSTAWQAPSPLRRHSGTNDEVALAQIVDIDGDGLLDWAEAYRDNGIEILNAWRNDGTTLVPDASFVLPGPLFEVSNPIYLRAVGQLVDLNSDGRPDYAFGERDVDNVQNKETYLRTDTGWTISSGYKIDFMIDYMKPAGERRGQLIDVNADGLIDWVRAFRRESGNEFQTIWLNSGSGWNKNSAWNGTLPQMLYDRTTSSSTGHKITSLIDVNGDGLPDMVQASTGIVAGTITWINQGDGSWVADSNFALPALLVNLEAGGHTQLEAALMDLNRDGLPELVRAYRTTSGSQNLTTWRNTGSGWVQDNSLNLPTALFQHRSGKSNYNIASRQDVNQDGYADVFSAQEGSAFTTWAGSNSLGEQIPEVLTQVTDGFGVEQIIDYGPSTNSADYIVEVVAGSYPIANANGLTYLATSLDTSDGSGGYSQNVYRYHKRKSHRLRGTTTYNFKRDADFQRQRLEDRVFYITDLDFGLLKHDRAWFFSGSYYTLPIYTTNSYTERSFHGGQTRLPSLTNQIVATRDDVGPELGTELQVTTTSYTYTDGTEAPISTVETSITTDSLASLPTITKTLTTNYHNASSPNWLVGLPGDSTTVSDQSGTTITNTVDRTYSAEGRVLTETFEPTTNDELAQQFTYDTFGNLTTYSVTGKTDASTTETRTTTTTYTADGRFPATVTNAEGHTASATYNTLNGQEWMTTDPNGIERETYYDDLGRVYKTSVTAAGAAALDYYNHAKVIHLLQSCVGDPSCPTDATHSVFTTSTETSPPATLRYLDKLRRPVRIRTLGDQGEFVFVDFEYSYISYDQSADGRYYRTVKQSVPYFSNSSDPILWTETTWDALGRVAQTINPDGVVTEYDYYGRTTKETKGANLSGYLVQDTITTVDMNGNPVQVTDAEFGTVQYQYDAHGNLTQTTDAGGTETTMVYDNLGRQTQLNDSSLGTTLYTYNAFDSLIELIDAKGQVFEYSYDKLDRPISRIDDSTQVSGPSVTTVWEYDGAVNGVGQLNRVTNDEGYERSHIFNPMSRVEIETVTMGTGGGGSETSVTDIGYYGISNRVDWTIYDSGFGIRKTTDAYGLPSEIRSNGFDDYEGYIVTYNDAQAQILLADELVADEDYQNTLASLTASYNSYMSQGDSDSSASASYISQAYDYLDQSDDSQGWGDYYWSEAQYNWNEANYWYDVSDQYWDEYIRLLGEAAWEEGEWYATGDPGHYTAWQNALGYANDNYEWSNQYAADANWYNNQGNSDSGTSNWYYNDASSAYSNYQSALSTGNSYANSANSAYASASDVAVQINAHQAQVTAYYNAAATLIDEAEAFLASYENGSQLHWKALAINARGQVTSYQQGDHITTNRTFIDTNGLLAAVNTQTSADYNAGTNDHQALVASDNVIQNDSYIWDVLGNLLERSNNVAGINASGVTTSLTETFSYDALNRMVTSDLSGTGAEIYELVGLSFVDYSYSANGNLTRRSDVGYLNYDHLTKSHAVTSVLYEGTSDIGDYTYDANGNMQTAPDGGSVDYTPFDKPKQITGADGTATQLYFGPERQLIREEVSSGGQTITTLHFGNYEKIIDGASVTDRYSVTGHNGEVVAMIVDEATPTTHYLHHDHLGSIAAISDSNGYVLERFHYDAFGKQRLAINASVGGINQSLNTDITRKGYTGHIELQTDSLTYMNARVYDSSLGRFMSADTIVPDPFHSQDFNRYSYVRNNPLRYTDPTGHQLCGTENVEDNNFTFGLCIQDFYDYRDIGYDERDELSGGPNGPGAPRPSPIPDPVSSGDGDVKAPPPHTPPVYRSSPSTGSERNGDGTLAGVVAIVGPENVVVVDQASTTLPLPFPFPGIGDILGDKLLTSLGRALNVFAAAVLLSGDTPRNNRGRIQAQGGGIDKSEPWAQGTPPTVEQGLELLDALKGQLSVKEFQAREQAFRRAERFIINAGQGGGVGPPGQSFLEQGTKDIRIDIDIFSGTAFER